MDNLPSSNFSLVHIDIRSGHRGDFPIMRQGAEYILSYQRSTVVQEPSSLAFLYGLSD